MRFSAAIKTLAAILAILPIPLARQIAMGLLVANAAELPARLERMAISFELPEEVRAFARRALEELRERAPAGWTAEHLNLAIMEGVPALASVLDADDDGHDPGADRVV